MATKRPLRFGVKTAPQHTTWDDILRIFEEADATPVLEHGWVFDHFVPLGGNTDGPCLEGWTLLAALTARTERLRVGVMVTGNTYRHPAVLANMGATVDQIAHGRLDFGIGAGWNETEHTMYGIPLYAPAERSHRLDEACEVIRLLWTEHGRYENAIRTGALRLFPPCDDACEVASDLVVGEREGRLAYRYLKLRVAGQFGRN